MLRASIPSPAKSFLEIGPLTIHFYALCIIAGIAVAIWLGDRRLRAINPQLVSVVADVAIVAVPAGILGGRLYHVISSPRDFFGSTGSPADIFAIWKGGLGIWGAISVGALAAAWAYRRQVRLKPELDFPPFARFLDALAPGILLAQAIGRFGNWFNIELFGRPLDTWWGLEIPIRYRPSGFAEFATFHPTFLYEAIWCTFVAAALLVFGKKLASGQTFALYIATYCLGRFFIENLRIDTANQILGLRQNQWVSFIIGAVAIVLFMRLRRVVGLSSDSGTLRT